jgi:chromate transport protein ChrA
VPRVVTAAAVLAGVQGLALVAIAVLLIVDTVVGTPHSLFGGLGGAVLALIAAAVLLVLGRQLAGLRRWARSPIVVLQVLWLPVSFSLAFQAGRPGYGGPILVSAIAILLLLATPEARAAFDPS